jgi:hypothetical protein
VREGYNSKDFGKKDTKNIWLDSWFFIMSYYII